MKKKSAIVALLGILFFLMEGCIPSLHPIYTEDKLVTLKELPGTWVEKDMQITTPEGPSGKPEVWNFQPGEDKNYLLIHADHEGNKAAFEVHVIKLGENYFMDFYPIDAPPLNKESAGEIFPDQEKVNSFKAVHMLPVHTFAKLEITARELRISLFDPDFLKRLLEQRQIRIKHEKLKDSFVLTAPPEELQKFAEKYASVKEAFLDNPVVLKNKL